MKQKVKSNLFCLLAAVLFAACFTFCLRAHSLQKEFDKNLYDNVLRLHIVANSNSPEAQSLKYALRDSILSHVGTLTEKAESASEARDILCDNITELKSLVRKNARKLGFYGKTAVTLSNEYYPVRDYDGFMFPAGKYLSLRILIGEAKGKNWWCVLYPSICTAASSDTDNDVADKLFSAGLSEKTVSAVFAEKGDVKFSFYFLELIQNFKKHREESCCTEFSAEKNTEKPISALKNSKKT